MRYIPADDQRWFGHRTIWNGYGDKMAISDNGSRVDATAEASTAEGAKTVVGRPVAGILGAFSARQLSAVTEIIR